MSNHVSGLRRGAALVAAAGLATSLAACEGLPGVSSEPAQPSASTTTTPPVRLVASVADGATGVPVTTNPTVRAEEGTLEAVTAVSTDGKRTVAGTLSPGGVWTATGELTPSTTYTLTATVRDKDDRRSTLTSTFSTAKPAKTIGYTVTPDGWTVGAGMPIQVNFDTPIASPQMRALIESKMAITTTPAQKAAWGWTSNATLMYRPATYWQPGTQISVKAPLAGVKVAADTYLMEDNGATMTVGTQRVLTVDLAKHTMALTENGKPVKTFLISGGRPGERFETRGGTKVLSEKYEDIVMDSSTFGIDKADPEYYRSKVQWAMRLTNSGEFLHSAPWSVEDQGKTNVSHGCINMAPEDAKWLFGRVLPGDVVETVGSSIPLRPDEAGIPVWLWSWQQWQAKSAGPVTPPAPKTVPPATTTAPATRTTPAPATARS